MSKEKGGQGNTTTKERMTEGNSKQQQQQQQRTIRKQRAPSNVVIIDLDTPIRPKRPWNVILFVIGLIILIHPLSWIILLHYERRKKNNHEEDVETNSFSIIYDELFNFLSMIILDIVPRIVSNLLTILFGIFFLITGLMNIRGDGEEGSKQPREGGEKMKTS